MFEDPTSGMLQNLLKYQLSVVIGNIVGTEFNCVLLFSRFRLGYESSRTGGIRKLDACKIKK